MHAARAHRSTDERTDRPDLRLDKLAAEGATFTQHYVMPQCTPTRLALFTGRYPGRFGSNVLM